MTVAEQIEKAIKAYNDIKNNKVDGFKIYKPQYIKCGSIRFQVK